ncbi:hypothetical protein AVEN_87593-1 [Araneus ventricosus]|uniref:Uncharacterized protein n=1 Tax=Araneus ventricosus TaxID=182803 RepID=A0A4Y2LRY7_ARAVE|nr:hypothetical protein AVEN_87593-1 [Araneus ventricosus]
MSSRENVKQTFSFDSKTFIRFSRQSLQPYSKDYSRKKIKAKFITLTCLSDSMSALKVLLKRPRKNKLVEDIRALVDDAVSLHWVKAHIGIAGNEATHKAAKEASNKPSIDLHLGLL